MIPLSLMNLQRCLLCLILKVILQYKENNEEDNRILIPITDKEAHVNYYAIYPKDKNKFYQPLLKQIKDLDWKKIKDLPKVFNNQ